MTEALLVSNLILWVLVGALGIAVLALVRQVGLLHERVAPVGALSTARGPEVGDPAPQLVVEDLSGRERQIGVPDKEGRRTLLFFLSPTCPICETLLPTLRRVKEDEGEAIQLILASDGELAEHEDFLRRKGLAAADYVLSTDLGLRFEVAKLPYAVLIDADGIVRAKGLVNTREHLESLFEAHEQGVASIQDYLERREVAS